MNNDNKNIKTIINSDLDISKTELNPTILENSIGKNIDFKKENNFLQKIIQKEKEIFNLYYDRLGRDFLNKKPESVVLFEKRLKKYLFSPDSKFLDNFPTIKKKIKSEINKSDNLIFNNKINIGPMIYYSLNDKRNKNELFIANNKEKYLETSKNFFSLPTKDIVNTEVYKMKYLEKNSRRINRILSNKFIKKTNKDKDFSLINIKSNKTIKTIKTNNKNNDNNFDNLKSISIEDKDISKNNYDSNENDSLCLAKSPSYDNNNNQDKKYNKKKNIIRYNSNSNNTYTSKYLSERKIDEYTKKNKINFNNYLSAKAFNSPEYINNKNNDIYMDFPSPTSTNHTYKKAFSELHNNYLGNINRKNTNIKLFKSKNSINLSKIKKNKSRNVINIEGIKIKSNIYKTNIDNNINRLDKYTKTCNSILLKLVRKNKSNKKKYSKKNINEDKELKALLSNKMNKKNKSNYMRNKIKQEKINKMKVLINDTFLDYDINKLLKEKTIYDKTNKNNDNIIRKHTMLSENIFFENKIQNSSSNSKVPKLHGLMSDKEKKNIIKNRIMKKLRQKIKINDETIKKLKNFIKIDQVKLISNLDNNNKSNNNEK